MENNLQVPEGPLFFDTDEVAKSEDDRMTTKKVCGEEEEVVSRFQSDSDVEICPNDISSPKDSQEDRVDVIKKLNRSGRQVRAASLGIGQCLVASPLSALVLPTPTTFVRNCSVSTGMTTAGTQVSWGWGYRSACRRKNLIGPVCKS